MLSRIFSTTFNSMNAVQIITLGISQKKTLDWHYISVDISSSASAIFIGS